MRCRKREPTHAPSSHSRCGTTRPSPILMVAMCRSPSAARPQPLALTPCSGKRVKLRGRAAEAARSGRTAGSAVPDGGSEGPATGIRRRGQGRSRRWRRRRFGPWRRWRGGQGRRRPRGARVVPHPSPRGHSMKTSRDFAEIDEDDNIEECTVQKPTVKKLMEDELGRVNLLKKFPNDELQRRLAGLGNDLSLDGNSEHTNKTAEALDHDKGICTSYLSGSVDSEGSKTLNHPEEYDLQSVL